MSPGRGVETGMKRGSKPVGYLGGWSGRAGQGLRQEDVPGGPEEDQRVPWWLGRSKPWEESRRGDQRLGWERSWMTLETTVRTLGFILSEIGSH